MLSEYTLELSNVLRWSHLFCCFFFPPCSHFLPDHLISFSVSLLSSYMACFILTSSYIKRTSKTDAAVAFVISRALLLHVCSSLFEESLDSSTSFACYVQIDKAVLVLIAVG